MLLAFGLFKQSLEAALCVPGGDVNSFRILPGVSRATCVKPSISKDRSLHKYPPVIFPTNDSLAGLLRVIKVTQG